MLKTFQVTALFVLAFAASLAFGAVKTYQVTGPVVNITDQAVVVQKGKEKWEIVKDAGTKVPSDLKVGDKVTIAYRMVGTDIEVKSGKDTKSAKKR